MQTFIIGRDAGNQIVLNDKLVSRRHAQLTFLDSGQVMIKDLGSSNGTFVNGKRITECYLNVGDIVKCGSVFLNWAQYAQSNTADQDKVDLLSVAGKAQEWNNKFVSFINPFLETIDDGSFFRRIFGWVYFVIAIFNILIPFYVLFKAFDNGIFQAEGKFVLTFLVFWLALVFLCWFGFQLWWNRRDKVNESSYKGAEFVATPVLAHFIQTLGEWQGVNIGVLGFLTGLLSLLFSRESINSIVPFIPFFSEKSWIFILVGPLIGFLILFLFRFFSEWIKALSVIANNTKNNK